MWVQPSYSTSLLAEPQGCAGERTPPSLPARLAGPGCRPEAADGEPTPPLPWARRWAAAGRPLPLPPAGGPFCRPPLPPEPTRWSPGCRAPRRLTVALGTLSINSSAAGVTPLVRLLLPPPRPDPPRPRPLSPRPLALFLPAAPSPPLRAAWARLFGAEEKTQISRRVRTPSRVKDSVARLRRKTAQDQRASPDEAEARNDRHHQW